MVYRTLFIVLFAVSISQCFSNTHPNLILSKKGVQEIKRSLGTTPLFDKQLYKTKHEIDEIISKPIDVPIPRDGGGGYTHERHKKNYNELYKAGILYQILGDEIYALFVKKMLMDYAEMYPKLPLHPVQKSNYRGKLFWQGLNECVWLVYASQAYDCIYEFLTEKEKKYIENNLFSPLVKFISEENATTFNKIHNHGTWAVAGVGMIGYVTNNKEWIEKAILGLNKDKKGGFLAQLDNLFSPDGYFAEGPYYQRYSLQPFIVFAQAIENNEPERNIFSYRDSILTKAVTTLLQMANTDGQFFHLNDALDKTWHSIELVYGVNIAYNITRNKELLLIAKEQNQVILGDAGIITSKALSNEIKEKYDLKTLLIRDGAQGDEGGIGILRMGNYEDQSTIVLKATAQGMGHGHFDKLSISFYDKGEEILQDYGAARFLNIEQKNGGHYLPENNTLAKQSIAHNTIVVDETSHYGGNLEIAEKHSPTIKRFINKEKFKLISAIDKYAYPETKMERTIIMILPKESPKPLIIDFVLVDSKKKHQYDLSYYYSGQIISTNLEYYPYIENRTPLGKNNGYQHLWKEAETKVTRPDAYFTFLKGNRFYTITTQSNSNSQYFFNRIGANDPNFNLRNDPSFMIRKTDESSTYFISVIEPHGEFNPREEYTVQSSSTIDKIEISEDYSIIEIQTNNNKTIKIDIESETFFEMN